MPCRCIEPLYLIVVPASEPGVFEHLERRFCGDHQVRVLLDRRAAQRTAEGSTHSTVLFGRVTIVRRGRTTSGAQGKAVRTHHSEEGVTMEGAEVLEDRQRVDRWLEESQYLLGRIIPGYLDDRERLKSKLVNAEQEADRMRQEVEELRREVASLQNDVQFYRNEQGAAAEAFASVMGQLTDLQKPLAEFHRRMQSTHPSMSHSHV